MRKLNRKGFTLVELLAVIIILAIVVGITIPAVLSTINSSRQKAGTDAAQIAANWIDEQYTIVAVDSGSADSNFKTLCGNNGGTCLSKVVKTTDAGTITSLGMKSTDVSEVRVKITASGKSCVTVVAASSGAYYVTSGVKDQLYTQGAGCTSDELKTHLAVSNG